MTLKPMLYGLGLVALLSGTSVSAPEDDVKEKWRTPFGLYLTPQEAYDMKVADPERVVLVDVRTRGEVKYIGMADLVDGHIPVRFLDPDYRWSDKSSTYRTRKNEDFAAEVENLLGTKNLNKDTPLILMCQSGSRAPRAAKMLHLAGFKQVYTQYQGFEGLKAKTGDKKGQRVVNGWKNADLPWSYATPKEKMYFNFNVDSQNPDKP